MLVTSNRPVAEWGGVFGDAVVATAILDRLLHHGHVITNRGDSYRLRTKRRAGLLNTLRIGRVRYNGGKVMALIHAVSKSGACRPSGVTSNACRCRSAACAVLVRPIIRGGCRCRVSLSFEFLSLSSELASSSSMTARQDYGAENLCSVTPTRTADALMGAMPVVVVVPALQRLGSFG